MQQLSSLLRSHSLLGHRAEGGLHVGCGLLDSRVVKERHCLGLERILVGLRLYQELQGRSDLVLERIQLENRLVQVLGR
jgi:hypothetical protein